MNGRRSKAQRRDSLAELYGLRPVQRSRWDDLRDRIFKFWTGREAIVFRRRYRRAVEAHLRHRGRWG